MKFKKWLNKTIKLRNTRFIKPEEKKLTLNINRNLIITQFNKECIFINISHNSAIINKARLRKM